MRRSAASENVRLSSVRTIASARFAAVPKTFGSRIAAVIAICASIGRTVPSAARRTVALSRVPSSDHTPRIWSVVTS
jgi:hypothetical protein